MAILKTADGVRLYRDLTASPSVPVTIGVRVAFDTAPAASRSLFALSIAAAPITELLAIYIKTDGKVWGLAYVDSNQTFYTSASAYDDGVVHTFIFQLNGTNQRSFWIDGTQTLTDSTGPAGTVDALDRCILWGTWSGNPYDEVCTFHSAFVLEDTVDTTFAAAYHAGEWVPNIVSDATKLHGFYLGGETLRDTSDNSMIADYSYYQHDLDTVTGHPTYTSFAAHESAQEFPSKFALDSVALAWVGDSSWNSVALPTNDGMVRAVISSDATTVAFGNVAAAPASGYYTTTEAAAGAHIYACAGATHMWVRSTNIGKANITGLVV